MLHETTKVTIQNLLTVKSLVTLMLTVVFAALSIIGKIDGKDFLNIFQIVVVFYFGTQYQNCLLYTSPLLWFEEANRRK